MTEEQVELSNGVEMKPEDQSSVVVSGSDGQKNETSTGAKADELSKAASALSQGKRSLLIKDVQQALSSLSDACNLYSQLLGPFGAPEAHYYYGKALLESARCELSVLPAEAVGKITDKKEDGNAKDDDDEESEEEEEEKAEDDDEDDDDKKLEEDLNEPSPAPAVTSDSVPGSSNDVANTGDANADSSAGAGNTSKTGEGGEDEQEQSSLELAWEVLEIAKVSYQKQLEEIELQGKGTENSKEDTEKLLQTGKDLKRKLADTHLLLGDVATESEFYEQAQAEFRTSLTILRDTEKENISREIAQCYFQLGLAYHFDKKFTESIDCYQKAITLIKNRIAELELLIEKKETKKDLEAKVTDANYSEATEIAELKGIVVDLEEKVADTVDAQKDSQRTKEEEKFEQEVLQRNSPVKNPNPPVVHDISHLVKKKKKLDEDDTEKLQPPAKKQCINPVISETAGAVSSTNGTHDAK